MFDWVSDFFIGKDIRKAKLFALSFVGSGFKTLFLMLLLVFWTITVMVLTGMLDIVMSFFT